jgi:hypothetical protein
MRHIYVLRIICEKTVVQLVSNILRIDNNNPRNNSKNNQYCSWEFNLIQEKLDPPVDFVNTFLNILEGKYEELFKVGVEKSDITTWMYYEYDSQCNLEFSPQDLKRLGDNDISLCISCWQSNDYDIEALS